MKRIAILAAIVLPGCATVLNTGDSDKLTCQPGKGTSCATPMQAYAATNPAAVAASPPPPSRSTGANAKGNQVLGAGRAVLSNVPKAVREPATIMRIKIYPWIDQNDDLHMGHVLYTEIQGRRWAMGKPVPRNATPIRTAPLEDPQAGAKVAAPEPATKPQESIGNGDPLLPKGGARGDL